MPTLAFADLSPLVADCHLARSFYGPGRCCGLHDHDFAEALWVEHGTVWEHTPLGSRALREGDILLVRPQHQHDLRGGNESAVVVNIAFALQHMHTMEQRYGSELC